MPFNTTAAAHVVGIRPHLSTGTRICHLCHHDLEVADHFLRWLVEHRAAFPFVNHRQIESILATEPEARRSMVPSYYEALGLGHMETLDSHSRCGSEIVDFNLNLKEAFGYADTFDFVDNTGVSEHVFDQRAIFENIHNLCNPGGTMLHRIPMAGVLNITLYCVPPLFLVDIAQANRYEILDIRVGNRWGDTVRVSLPDDPETLAPTYRSAIPMFPGHTAGLSGEGPKTKVWRPESQLPPSLQLPDSLSMADIMQKTSLAVGNTPLGQTCQALTERARQFRPENPGELYAMAVFRKKFDEPFRNPFQSTSIFDIEPITMRRRYRHQFAALGIPIPNESN